MRRSWFRCWIGGIGSNVVAGSILWGRRASSGLRGQRSFLVLLDLLQGLVRCLTSGMCLDLVGAS